MNDHDVWLIGVTWPAERGFRLADEIRRIVRGPVRCIGAPFPRLQPRIAKYLVVWPLYALVTARLALLSMRWRARIVCWQQAYGVGLGLVWHMLESLGLRCRSDIDVLTFILSEDKRRGWWRAVIGFALGSRAIKKVVVFNAQEFDLYRALFPAVAHKFVHLLYSAAEVPQGVPVGDEGYYLAVGRSNRDHRFLIEAFRQFPQRRLVVLSDQREQAASANVTVQSRAFGPDYYRWLGRCHAVVLAFDDASMSSGQLVYLQAVQHGKPVLASRSHCLEGYMLEGRTGLAFDKTTASLDAALAQAEDPAWHAKATRECLADYRSRFGFERLAQSYVDATRDGG